MRFAFAFRHLPFGICLQLLAFASQHLLSAFAFFSCICLGLLLAFAFQLLRAFDFQLLRVSIYAIFRMRIAISLHFRLSHDWKIMPFPLSFPVFGTQILGGAKRIPGRCQGKGSEGFLFCLLPFPSVPGTCPFLARPVTLSAVPERSEVLQSCSRA